MNLEDLITKYWAFVLFIMGLVFHAIWTYFRVDEHGKRISKLEEEHAITANSVSELKEMISSINAKLDILVEGYSKKKK